MKKNIRVLLVDDHAVLRAGLRLLLDAEADIEVVGEAEDGLTTLSLLDELSPDLLILDLTMPGLSGLETLQTIKQRRPFCKVLVLTMHNEESFMRRALSAGASGYVLKQADDQELLVALRAVFRGQIYVSPALTPALLKNLLPKEKVDATDKINLLSEREEQVIRLVSQGYTSQEVAQQLHLAVTSVETYRSRATQKLGLQGRVELVQFALKQGWLKEE